jgi:hypothetical protein
MAGAFVASLAISPRIAHADPPAESSPPARAQKVEPWHRLTITISPLHLTRPIFEMTSEARLAPRLGAAVITGIGSIGTDTNRARYWNVGGQFITYPFGTFENGVQLGFEAQYIGLSGSRQAMNLVDGAVNSVNLAPFVGYKIVTSFGLSLHIQSGVAYATAPGKFGALFNAGLGWSF